jgi:hypothetical protein
MHEAHHLVEEPDQSQTSERWFVNFERRSALPSHRTLWVLVSLSLCLLVPALSPSRFADLSSRFTDHMHHCHAAWLFWKHGLSVFTTQFGHLDSTGYRYIEPLWPQAPWMYPPGALLLFGPVAWLVQSMELTPQQYAIACSVNVIVLSHISLYWYLEAADQLPSGIRTFASVLGWLVIAQLAVEGFFDTVWIGVGALAMTKVHRGEYGKAFLALAAAATFHYRAFVVAPAALVAMLRVYRSRNTAPVPWYSLAVAAVSGLLTVASFIAMSPAAEAVRAHAAPFREIVRTPLFVVFAAITVFVVVYCVVLRAWPSALVVACVAIVAATDFQGYIGYWNHASVVVAMPLSVLLFQPIGDVAERVGQATILYGVLITKIVWLSSPMDIVQLVVDRLR